MGSANDNMFSNQTINSSDTGFYVSSICTNNSLYDSEIFNSSSTGIARAIYLSSATDTTISNVTIHNSTYYGFYLSSSNNTIIEDSRVYGSAPAAYISLSTNQLVNMSNVTFDSPAGNYSNYTVLSLYDLASALSRYYINWTSEPPSPPYTSFEQKFVNISTVVGTSAIIDSVVWHWTDAELSGYDESLFELWKYNSHWLGRYWRNTKHSSKHTHIDKHESSKRLRYSQTDAPVTCPIINASGSYVQTGNYVGAPNAVSVTGYPTITSVCLYINASDVIFDCDGYSITHNASPSGTLGVIYYPGYENITLRNCQISSYETGLFGLNVNSTLTQNNTIFNSSASGLILRESNDSVLDNNTVYDSLSEGFVHFDLIRAVFTNNTAYNNTEGFSIQDSSYVNMTDNVARNNTVNGVEIVNGNILRLVDNLAYNNTLDGFNVVSSNSYLIDNIAYDNRDDGFQILSGEGRFGPFFSDNSTLTDNYAYNNTGYGFYITGDVDRNISNITATGNNATQNTQSGFFIDQANESRYVDNLSKREYCSGYHSQKLLSSQPYKQHST